MNVVLLIMIIQIKEIHLNKNNYTPLHYAKKGSKTEALLISSK